MPKLSEPRASLDDRVIAQALAILEKRLVKKPQMKQPNTARDYIKLSLHHLEVEEFHALFLDNHHQMIEFRMLARGTIDGASVYPREVVKAALACNAAAVIFAHNHPSGIAEPSAADRGLTDRLKAALALVDIRVLDHFVVGEGSPVSFAERGLI